jgi:hypothetical protein
MSSWLVQINDAGHALTSQYPYKFDKVLQNFLQLQLQQQQLDEILPSIK